MKGKRKMGTEVRIVDVTRRVEYERYLYKCLAPMPFRKYRKRKEYLERALPKGFCKKILFFKGLAVGQIEYVPAEASGYPIKGANVVVMHCIWVLRKAKGHRFGKRLMFSMIKECEETEGFATLALEGHWSPWLEKGQMEYLGFKPVASITVTHKMKHKGEKFKIYLMWFPKKEKTKPPLWDEKQLLEGIHFCTAHPLYHPQSLKEKQMLERIEA
jgi:L-amino acid N-acyltransferase YncA